MTVEPAGPGSWLVREEREHDGETGTGAIRVNAASENEAAGSGRARIAGALAWAALGRRLLEHGNVEGALAAARTGLDELGEGPVNPGMADDTALKLAAANDRVAAGHERDGAEVMLDVLDIRGALHARASAAEVAG